MAIENMGIASNLNGENVLYSSSISDEELESIKQWDAHISDEQAEEKMKVLVEKGYLS